MARVSPPGEVGVHRCGQIRQRRDGLAAPVNDVPSRRGQLLVPEVQLGGLRPALPDGLQQVVPLRDDALVALKRSQVRLVELRYQDVHVAAPHRGRAEDDVQVARLEDHRVDLADQVRRAAPEAVNPHLLADLRAVVQRPDGAAALLVRRALDREVDLDSDRPVRPPRLGGDLRLERLARRRVTHQLALRGGAIGLGYREDVQRLEQVALALRVAALEQHDAGRQLQLQLRVAPKAQQAEPADVDGWPPGGRTGPARGVMACGRYLPPGRPSPADGAVPSASLRNSSSVMTVTSSCSASASFDPAPSPATR